MIWVTIERSDWSGLGQESSNENEAHDIPVSDSSDIALRLLETWPMSVKDEKQQQR